MPYNLSLLLEGKIYGYLHFVSENCSFPSLPFCLEIIKSLQRFNRHLHAQCDITEGKILPKGKQGNVCMPQRGKLSAKFYRLRCEKDFLIRRHSKAAHFTTDNFSHCSLINSLELFCCLVLQFLRFWYLHFFSLSVGAWSRIYWLCLCLRRLKSL